MRAYRAAVLLALLVQSLGASSAQPPALVPDGFGRPDPQIATSLARYLSGRSARFVDWLADGSMLIAARLQDATQIERVRTPLGTPDQVSFAPEGVISASARPYTSDAFIYLTPLPGTGGTQLFLQRLGEARPRPLGDGEPQGSAALWAHDGKRIAFSRREGPGADVAVYVLDTSVPDAVPTQLAGGEGNRWRVFGWSSNDRRLLLGLERASERQSAAVTGALAASENPGAEREIYLAEVDGGAVVPVLAPHALGARPRKRDSSGAAASFTDASMAATAMTARFASDGRGILLLTHQIAPEERGQNVQLGREFLHLCYTDPADGLWRQLSAPSAHDVELFDQSADGRYLAYTFNDEGVSRLRLLDRRAGEDLPVSELPEGIISTLRFDPRGAHLAVTLESTRAAADVYVVEPDTHALSRWTRSAEGLQGSDSFVQPEKLYFPTWDEVDGQARQLSALLYRPAAASASAEAAAPVVIWLCSGGGAQCRPLYAPFVQYLVQKLGFAVVAPNVRGSSGFGESFQAAGEGPLQGDAVRDIGSLLVWIGLQPGLDASRVALLGEGYGSYLALAALAQFGDRLGGAVAAFPPPLAGLTNALRIRRPVLIVQGLDAPAVSAYEAAQLLEGLRANGVAVQYLAAPREAEAFTRGSHSDAYRAATAAFLVQLLR